MDPAILLLKILNAIVKCACCNHFKSNTHEDGPYMYTFIYLDQFCSIEEKVRIFNGGEEIKVDICSV